MSDCTTTPKPGYHVWPDRYRADRPCGLPVDGGRLLPSAHGWITYSSPCQQNQRDVCEPTGARGPRLRAISQSAETPTLKMLRMMLVLLEDPS